MNTPQDDLRSLIDATGSAPNPQQPVQNRPHVPSVAAPGANDDIQSLIHQAGTAGAAAPPRHKSSTTGTELNEAVREAHAGDAAPDGPIRPRSVLTRPRLLAAALVLVLLLAAWAWHTMQPELTGPPATLRDLAQGVEQYRSQHSGSLPTQLSDLPQFPKGAVEWQLKFWRARDAAGRTEIMWAPNGSQHYRIVQRQGGAVWIYKDNDGLSRQTQQ